jgi:hypothetical protein
VSDVDVLPVPDDASPRPTGWRSTREYPLPRRSLPHNHPLATTTQSQLIRGELAPALIRNFLLPSPPAFPPSLDRFLVAISFCFLHLTYIFLPRVSFTLQFPLNSLFFPLFSPPPSLTLQTPMQITAVISLDRTESELEEEVLCVLHLGLFLQFTFSPPYPDSLSSKFHR